MYRCGQRSIGLHIDENLGLEAGTYCITENVATAPESVTTTTDPPANSTSTDSYTPRAINTQ